MGFLSITDKNGKEIVHHEYDSNKGIVTTTYPSDPSRQPRENIMRSAQQYGQKSTQPMRNAVGGMAQGHNGYLSQASNKILNTLLGNMPTYNPPSMTKDILTLGGHNQALNRIVAKNKWKAALKNRDNLTRVLGSLISADASRANTLDRTRTNIATTMINDKTANRRIGITDNYYKNLIAAQKRGQDLNYQAGITNALSRGRPKEVNPLDAAIKRKKVVPDSDTFKTFIPSEIADEISSENLDKAYMHYIQTGQIPQFKAIDGIFDTDYEPFFGEQQKATQAVQVNDNRTTAPIRQEVRLPDQFKQEAEMATKQTGKNVVDFKIIDGKPYYKLENGSIVTF